MVQNTEEIIHKCINNCKRFKECQSCPIFLKDYCEIFQKVLKPVENILKNKYHINSIQDRQDIISNTIEGITKDTKKQIKENITPNNPIRIMKAIFNFKKADYFRALPKFTENNEFEVETTDNVDVVKIQRIDLKYKQYIKWDSGAKTIKSLSINLPNQLKEELKQLSNNKKWYQKVNNFFRFNGLAIVQKEGDQKPVEDNNQKKPVSIEDFASKKDQQENNSESKQKVNRLIAALENMKTKSAQTCSRFFKEYLKVLKEDGVLNDLSQIFGITPSGVRYKMIRCRELVLKIVKGK